MKQIRQNKKIHATDYMFTLFFAGLLLSTYIAYGEEYIALCGGIALVSALKRINNGFINEKAWLLFVFYYLTTTIVGFGMELLDGKGFLEYFIQYPIMIIVIMTIIKKTHSIENSMRIFKIFILLSALYGLIESIVKHNILPDLFSAPVMNRIEYMNIVSYKYQSSSFYLHYSYFGVVLLVGIAINMIYPFKTQISNICYYALSIMDLYYAKSRLCLLIVIILIIYDFYKKGRITIKMLRRGLMVFGGILIITAIFWNPISKAIDDVYRKFAIVNQYGFEYGSFGQRIGTLLRVPSYMLKHPVRGLIGTGFMSIKHAFLDEYSYFQDYGIADNQLTTLLIEVGIVGTIIAIVGIIRFFRKNRIKRSLSKYLVIIVLCSSITLDVVGTIYITALVFLPFVLFYEYERKQRNVKYIR